MNIRRVQSTMVAALGAVAIVPTVLWAPAQAESSVPRPAAVSVSGYDYHTLLAADVVAGSAGNNLVIRYQADRAVEDGVLRILLPKRVWTTDLQPVDGLYEHAEPGGFSVRPGISAEGEDLPEPTLTSESRCEPGESGSWGVSDVPGGQLVTVRGVTCAAGEALAIRFEGLNAPARPGVYAVPVTMTSAATRPSLTIARIRVVPTPRVRLVLAAPPFVASGEPFIVAVSAIGPHGRPALGYRGAIVITDPGDCSFSPSGQQVVHRFIAADHATTYLLVSLEVLGAHRLRVYDVAHRAVETVSQPFEVGGPPPGSISCPVSYH